MKKIFEYILILACLVPLFFINIRTSHDWGDDFALYIKQAKNINAGIPQNETGYIFNENCFVVAPQAYPIGFPLLLSFVIDNSSSINYPKLDLYITFFLTLTCFVGFLILRRYTAFLTAFVTTLIIAYNPILVNFKSEVFSDLPFAFFSMLCVYLMLQKENYILAVLLGLVIGFTLHIRTIGFVLVPAFTFHKFFIENDIKQFSIKKQFHSIITLITSLLFYLIIKIAFPCNSKYVSFFDTEHFWNSVSHHLLYNLSQFVVFFGNQHSVSIIASSCLVVFSILGYVYFFKTNKRSVINVYVVMYFIILLTYWYSEAGMRFLFPILFLIFLYAIIGLKQSLAYLNLNNRVLAAIAGILILWSYKDPIEWIKQSENNLIDGPEIPEAKAAFEFINNSLPEKTVVVFPLPKVLALYTHAKSVTLNCANSDEEILEDIKKFDVKYVLNSEGLTAEPVKNFISKDTSLFKPVFSNSRFVLYRVEQ